MQASDIRIFTIDAGFKCNLSSFEIGRRTFQRGFISQISLATSLQLVSADGATIEDRFVTSKHTLRAIAVRSGFDDTGASRGNRLFELTDTILRTSQQCLFLPNDRLVRFGINSKEHGAFLDHHICIDVHALYDAPDCRDDGCRDEKFSRHVGVGVVVVHYQNQCPNKDDPSKCGGWHRPLVEWHFKDFEDCYADCRVRQEK